MKSQTAFTLVELAVVMVILGVLFAATMPALSLARSHARSAACMDNLAQVGRAIQRYRADHGDRIPDSLGGPPSLAASGGGSFQAPGPSNRDSAAQAVGLASYYADPRVIECPEIREAGAPSYGLNGVVIDTIETFRQIPSPSSTPLVFDARLPVGYHSSDLDKRHLGHVNILYADFRVARRYFNAQMGLSRPPLGSSRASAALANPFASEADARARVEGMTRQPGDLRLPERIWASPR